jgi:capsular exopolysaccharide synthesis family protein
VSEASGENHAWGLGEYVGALRRRKWIVLLAVVGVPLLAIGLALAQPSQYRASADVLMNRSNIGATLLGVPDPSTYQDPVRFSDTQSALARVPEVTADAARIARVPGVTGVYILDNSVVRPSPENDLLTFSVSSRIPEVASKLATAYAQAFIAYSDKLNTTALQQARSDLNRRLKELRAAGLTRTTLYANLAQTEQQLRTLELLQSRHKLVRPSVEATKVSPKPLSNAVLGLMGGLLVGLGIALVLETLDKRVRSEDVIERRLQLPLLARIPDPPRSTRNKRDLVMLVDPRSLRAEPFRRLRVNLEFVNRERQARTILVTSATSGEGKSTTVANLAVAAARAGQRVALVDLDLRLPTLHEFFRVPRLPGATDVALGRIALEDGLRKIALDDERTLRVSTNGQPASAPGTLEFLSVGTLPPNPGEFLGTDGIGETLSALSERSDVVFVDAPPLLSVGDTLPLSARVDGVVIVTRFGIVSRSMLTDLVRALNTIPTDKLGVIITGAGDEETHGYGYGSETVDDRFVEIEQTRSVTPKAGAGPPRWTTPRE